VLRKSFPLVLSTAVFVVSSYLVNLWLGRHLGPADYGVLGVVTSLMSALNVMQVSGVPQGMAKIIAEDPDHADDVLRVGVRLQLLLSAVLVAVLAGASPLLARVFDEPGLVGYVLLAALVLPGYGLLTVYGGFFQGLHLFGRQAGLNAVYAIAKLVLIVPLSLAYGIRGALVGYILSPLAALVRRLRRPRGTTAFEGRRLLVLSAPLVGYSALSLLLYSVDLFSVKALVDDRASAGYYVAAQSVSIIPFLGLAALGQVTLPSVSRALSAGDHVEAARVAGQAIRYQLMLLLPASALICGSAHEVVVLLYGSAYSPAGSVLRVLVLAYVPVSLFGLFAAILNGAGRARTTMALAGLGVVTAAGLCLWWVPQGGTVAAAAMGCGAAVAMAASVPLVRRTAPVVVEPAVLARIVGAALVVALLAAVPVPAVALVVLWPLLLVLYGALLWVLREVTPDERRQVRLLLARAARR
jgi:O-antigen/teichoic acid export membrane protein